MSSISDWIKQNGLGVTLLSVGVLALGVLGACSGFSVGDHVKFKVPQGIRQATNSAAEVSVNEAPFVRDQAVTDFQRDIDQFDGAFESAADRVIFFNSLIDTGINTAIGSSGIPAGGALALALGGLGGLFLKSPGTAKREAELAKAAEDRGYDMARLEGASKVS